MRAEVPTYYIRITIIKTYSTYWISIIIWIIDHGWPTFCYIVRNKNIKITKKKKRDVLKKKKNTIVCPFTIK